LFGIFAGRLLKTTRVHPDRKVAWLLAGGALAVALGFAWSVQFPLIKRIWSSSFCLVASGYAAMLLAVFYQVIDVWRMQRWCTPFVWMGMNSITIYVGANLLGFSKIAERLVGGDVKAYLDTHVAVGFGNVLIAVVSLALAFLLCWFLHRKRIFLRV
jgi:predicted acyltransferase